MTNNEKPPWKIFHGILYAYADRLTALRILPWWHHTRLEDGWVLQGRTDDGWKNRHFVSSAEGDERAIEQLQAHAESLYPGRLSAPAEYPLS